MSRLGLIAIAVCALVAGAVVWWTTHQQHVVDQAHNDVVIAKQETAGAKLQVEITGKVAETVDRLDRRKDVITREVAHEIAAVSVPLDDDASVEGVVLAWASGVDRLRTGPQAGASADEGIDRDTDLSLGVLHA